jgi:hypothetical protein
MKKTFLLLCCIFAMQIISAQNWQVTGVVTAEDDGLPMPGATVKIYN